MQLEEWQRHTAPPTPLQMWLSRYALFCAVVVASFLAMMLVDLLLGPGPTARHSTRAIASPPSPTAAAPAQPR